MKGFSRDRQGRRDSGRFGRGRQGGFGRKFGKPQMTEVTCDKCGELCEVPFKPSGDKPVYCKKCFSKDDMGSSRERPAFRREERGRPRERPAFRREESGKPRERSDQSGKELEAINEKLDRILRALNID